MKIAKIEVGIPSGAIDNRDILELLKLHASLPFKEIESSFYRFINKTGAENRFWRQKDNEPDTVLLETAQKLFNKFDKGLIDIVISCGVTKYFAEPAHASIFCKRIGLTPSVAFDVSDGCMGWLSALDVLHGYSSLKEYKYGLIVSHEFPMGKNGAIYPGAFEINDVKALTYKLPALTVGEATSLTVVELSETKRSLKRIEFPQGAELCTMPFRNYADFCGDVSFIYETEQFHAHFNEMSKIGAKPSLSMLNDFITDKHINLIPHAYTHSFEKLARFLKFNPCIINYFAEYGNLATSTIPLSLVAAHQRNELDLRLPTYAWCASAGIKSAVMQLNLAQNFS